MMMEPKCIYLISVDIYIYEYPLSTAFDVSTAGSSSNFYHNTGVVNSLSFDNDGTKLFILEYIQ